LSKNLYSICSACWKNIECRSIRCHIIQLIHRFLSCYLGGRPLYDLGDICFVKNGMPLLWTFRMCLVSRFSHIGLHLDCICDKRGSADSSDGGEICKVRYIVRRSYIVWRHKTFIVSVVESIFVTEPWKYIMSWGERSVQFDWALGSVGRNCWILNVRFVFAESLEVTVPILIRNSVRGIIWYVVTSPIARISSDMLVICRIYSIGCVVDWVLIMCSVYCYQWIISRR